MRYKSLPLSLRHPRHSTSSPAPRPDPHPPERRLRDWIATGLMVASLPVSLALALATMAATPTLQVTGVASRGAIVSVHGSAMPRNSRLLLAWDGSMSGLPTVRSDRSGVFTASLTIPPTATLGAHVLAAETASKGKSNHAGAIVASVTVQVVAASASPSPTVRPTPTPTVRVTPTPSPTVRVTPTPTPTPTPSPSGSGSVDHVFVILMENHSANEVYGTSSTPYTNSLANTYARAANYFAMTHPSLPNYLDVYAGTTNGLTTDCNPSSSCTLPARTSLVDNLTAHGLTWKAYFEGMPSNCDITDGGTYRAHHNPIIYFPEMWQHPTSAPCATHVVPMFPALTTDLASAATTPNWAFVKPDNCHDTHDCSIATGDTWLSQHVPTILNSPACTVDTCLVILTWDEDDGSQGNQVLTVFAGSAAKLGVVSSVHYDHFDLLRTVESVLGVPTQTANDAAGTRMSDLLR